MFIRSFVLVPLLFVLACQSQNNKSKRPVDSANTVPRGMGPVVETTMMPTDGMSPAEVPNEGASSETDFLPGVVVMSQPPEESEEETPVEREVGPVAFDSNPNLPFGAPKMYRKGGAVLISRGEYMLSWNRDTRNADWAAWRLTPDDLGEAKRSEAFEFDPDLQDYLSDFGEKAVRATEYKGSCFDRGHTVPSADRTSDPEANAATFYMSNMIPQTAFLNRIIWENLERTERELAQKEKCVWITAGPIYGKRMGRIGSKAGIAVPEASWKVITTCKAPAKVLAAVIMPNVNADEVSPIDSKEECSSIKGKLSSDWEDYQKPLSEIEKKARIKIPLGK